MTYININETCHIPKFLGNTNMRYDRRSVMHSMKELIDVYFFYMNWLKTAPIILFLLILFSYSFPREFIKTN